MTQTPRPERRGRAAAQFTSGMEVRLKADPDQTFTVNEPHEDGWWDNLLLPGVARWEQLLVEDPQGIRRWRLVRDLEPVPPQRPVPTQVTPKNPPKKVTPDATA
jgi:hypothetical protein